jgi:formate dehydrogenase subunit delta
MQGNKLVTMVNQIADFHRRQPDEMATAEVAQHLKRFWEPRMRKAIYAHLESGGEGMSAISRSAVEQLKASEEGALPFDPGAPSKLRDPLEA